MYTYTYTYMYIYIHTYIHTYIYIYIYICILLFSFPDLGGGRRHVGSTSEGACGSPRRVAPPHTYQEQPLQGRSYCAYLQAPLVCMDINDACPIAAIFLVALVCNLCSLLSSLRHAATLGGAATLGDAGGPHPPSPHIHTTHTHV